MKQEELNKILELHGKWLSKEEGGVRADLRHANLSYANLSYANLSYANLSYANLSYANLSGANLRVANLSGANLRVANLVGADLKGTDLRGTDLRGASLRGASLRGVDLDFACWQLSCHSTQVIGDSAIVGQLLWHALEHAKSSGIDITSLEQIKELANGSSPVIKHGKGKV